MLFEGEFIPVFHHRINADDFLNHLLAKHERARTATAVEIQCPHAGTGLAHRTADGLVFAFAHAKSIISVSNQIYRPALRTLIIGKGRLQGKGKQVYEQPLAAPRLAILVRVTLLHRESSLPSLSVRSGSGE